MFKNKGRLDIEEEQFLEQQFLEYAKKESLNELNLEKAKNEMYERILNQDFLIPIQKIEKMFDEKEKAQTFRKIIFPQMVKRIIPPVTNEIITLVKDTSLAFVVTYAEMFTIAKQVAAAKTTIVPLFVAGVFYYIFNYLVAFVMEKVEKGFSYLSHLVKDVNINTRMI